MNFIYIKYEGELTKTLPPSPILGYITVDAFQDTDGNIILVLKNAKDAPTKAELQEKELSIKPRIIIKSYL